MTTSTYFALMLAIAPSFASSSAIDVSNEQANLMATRQSTTESKIDLRTCYYDLLSAAAYDSTVSQSDFITFIQLSSNNTLGYTNQWGVNITGFNMLNPEFVGIYNLYACGDKLVGCPSIEGIDIGVGGSGLQVNDGGTGGLLSGICNDVYGVIDELSMSSPTISPSVGGSLSPTITPSTNTSSGGNTACPPAYVPNTLYEAFAQVTSPNDGSTGTNIYECKDAPYTAWCSQAAYEPGVAMPWGEAWSLVGECRDVEENITTVGPTNPDLTITTTGPTDPDLSTVIPITTETPDTTTPGSITSDKVSTVGPMTTGGLTNPDLSTVVPITTEAPDITTTGVGPTVDPGGTTPVVSTDAAPTTESTSNENIMPSTTPNENPDDPLYNGPLVVDFQYEVGNNIYLNAQAIERNEPKNGMMTILLDSTNALVEKVASETFKRRGLRSVEVRVLLVSYSEDTTSIDNLKDIFCPSSQPGNVLCQKVSCKVELLLSNEPKFRTELKFKNNLYRAIDNGSMTFPKESGIVYSSPPRPVMVVSEIMKEGSDNGGESTDGTNGGSKNSWVVPVSITVAVLGIFLLALSVGFYVVRKKHRRESELVQNSLQGDDLSNDIKGPEVELRHEKGFLQFDVEKGSIPEPQSKKEGGKNPFMGDSSSSSGSSSEKSKSNSGSNSSSSSSSSSSSVSSSKEDLTSKIILNLKGEEDDDEGQQATLASPVSSMTSDQNKLPTDQAKSQIASALDGGKSPREEAQTETKAAAAAAGTSDKDFDSWSSDSDDSSDSDYSSSSEGSSEWSTDEGLSSVDASLETEESVVNTTPSMLAAIGVASSITKQVGVDDVGSFSSRSDKNDHATKQDLSEAIQAGDWTAVSATAALLAKTDMPARSSLSETSVSSEMSGSTLGQVSLERASEFSKLVEAGDWEGVMRAAAQYEGASDTSSLHDSRRSMLDDMSSGNLDGGSPREDTDVRTEVETLVRQVVPDEIDNIDEMLTQYKGREQDLINTLRTMQDQKDNTPIESPNDLYASPEMISAAHSVFESDSIKSPFWDDSSKTNSSLNNGSDRESTSSRSELG